MPEGKRIKVNMENITLQKNLPHGLKPGKFVKIVISDEGIGIPEEHIDKIFDPYFTTKQKGSGLGLATSYSIIRRHDGHIQVKSKIGEGTDVEIFIPASESQVHSKHQKSDIIENGDGRILVMDDEEMVRDLSVQFLTHLGYDVEAVPDGEGHKEVNTPAPPTSGSSPEEPKPMEAAPSAPTPAPTVDPAAAPEG